MYPPEESSGEPIDPALDALLRRFLPLTAENFDCHEALDRISALLPTMRDSAALERALRALEIYMLLRTRLADPMLERTELRAREGGQKPDPLRRVRLEAEIFPALAILAVYLEGARASPTP